MPLLAVAGAVVLGFGVVSSWLPGSATPAAGADRGGVAGATATPARPTGSTVPRTSPAPGPTGPLLGAQPTAPASEPPGPPRPPAPETLTGYQWPLPNGRLTLPFGHTKWGSRWVDEKPFHDGIDLATFCGDRIVAAHEGKVLAAGRRYDDFIGWQGDLTAYYDRLNVKKLWMTLPIVVVVDDGNGYWSIYAHFRKVVVKAGDVVKAGQLLGYEGDTGRASGCHLHYGLFSPLETDVFEIKPDVVERMKFPRYITKRIDPLLVLPPR